MSGSAKSYRQEPNEPTKQGHIRMRASVWDRCDDHALKRHMSRALIIEAGVSEYLDKLDRLDRQIADAERKNNEG